jgi:hypothetical protein
MNIGQVRKKMNYLLSSMKDLKIGRLRLSTRYELIIFFQNTLELDETISSPTTIDFGDSISDWNSIGGCGFMGLGRSI